MVNLFYKNSNKCDYCISQLLKGAFEVTTGVDKMGQVIRSDPNRV